VICLPAGQLHVALRFAGLIMQLLAASFDIAAKARHRVAPRKCNTEQYQSDDTFQHKRLLSKRLFSVNFSFPSYAQADAFGIFAPALGVVMPSSSSKDCPSYDDREYDDCNGDDQEQEEQDFRDAGSACCDTGKAEEAGDDRYQEENKRPLQHESAP
jgi:hypothetical protein